MQLITRLSKKLTASIEVFHHSTQIISERENKGSERWLLIVSLGISIKWHCCKVSDEAAFCLIQRPYISKTLLT
ncbi:hypothetical protein AIZ21_14140, partial [Salmonella enterica subsp. enterica serovar Typhimurium]|uniref:hypothetical protein n=1 Tax=Salmonella enterica TaxID=28901 RepID=UPI00077E0C13